MKYVMYFRFVDDDMFLHDGSNGAESNTTRFRPVRQVAAPGAKLLSTIADLSLMRHKNKRIGQLRLTMPFSLFVVTV